MSWMTMLYETYENNAIRAGERENERVPLTLLAHMTANAQLEITITADGAFYGAAAVDKNNSKIIIPVTEASAGRASGIAPHPLCDKLAYIAGDFAEYAGTEKEQRVLRSKFAAYSTALEQWAQSEFSHPKVRAVNAYIKRESMLSDLIAAGIVKLDADGNPDGGKIQGKPYDAALVRFRVLAETEDTATNAVWEDRTLFDAHTARYLTAQKGKPDICYISGKRAVPSVNHPKGIVASSYGAKLLSANDASNFTYRGRFTDAAEAVSVSYEASQKAHSALTWLAANQGLTVGTKDKRTYICWNPLGKRTAELDDILPPCIDGDAPDTEPLYKERLRKTIDGKLGELDDCDDIVVIGLDAATTGRLSVIYYNELKASDFRQRLVHWGETCCWHFLRKSGGLEIRPPATRDLVKCAFGTEQGRFLELRDGILKEQYQRILHCILDGTSMPRDIMHALFVKASNPQAYGEGWNRESVLSTACAVIRKYHMDARKGVRTDMAIEEENLDRSYLFGRLLAIGEKAEKETYDRDENRMPNAIRLQATFVQYPARTWGAIERALLPYYKQLQKLRPGMLVILKNQIGDILGKLGETGGFTNAPLNERYLLGYYGQRAAMYQKKQQS
ncbi:MAG: type I-C CRISPR-associated protein Cas8c/Csd1 [Oscillospiraceae bacterium]